MTILELSFDEATEDILLKHKQAKLGVITTNNTNLRAEKQAICETW